MPDLLFLAYDFTKSRILRKESLKNDTLVFEQSKIKINSNSPHTSQDRLSRSKSVSNTNSNSGFMIPKQIPLSIGNDVVQINCESIDDFKTLQIMLKEGISHAQELKHFASNIQDQFQRIQRAMQQSMSDI